MRWLWVAFTLRFMLGDLKGTREVSEQALASSVSDPSCRCEAHHAMGGMLIERGELDASRDHFEAALAAYDEQHPQRSALGSDLGVFAHAWYRARTLAARRRGRRGGACRARHRARAAADHLFSQTIALAYAALLHQMRRDSGACSSARKRVVALCERLRVRLLRRLGAGAALDGRAVRSEPADGVEMIESALERLDAQPRAGAPAVLPLAARRNVQPRSDRRIARPRFWMRPSTMATRARRRVVASRAVSSEERARAAAGARRDASPGPRAGPRAKQPGPGAADSRVVDCAIDLSDASGLPRIPSDKAQMAANAFTNALGTLGSHTLSLTGGSL